MIAVLLAMATTYVATRVNRDAVALSRLIWLELVLIAYGLTAAGEALSRRECSVEDRRWMFACIVLSLGVGASWLVIPRLN
jgi:hypothetical protein